MKQLLANATIVLKHPKSAENIGATARCIMNMGLSRLIIVRDQEPEREKMLMMATHKAAHIVDAIECYGKVADALAPFSFVVGTTARLGRHRQAAATPREMADRLISHLANNQVAILFGPEDRGLTNNDLALCNLVTTIPTSGFSSLNLAQAVAIHCYEIHCSVIQATNNGNMLYTPRLATSFELKGMYEHIEQVLLSIGFLRQKNDDYWMRNIRNFLGRVGLRAREVKIIRGFCRKLLWHNACVGKKELE